MRNLLKQETDVSKTSSEVRSDGSDRYNPTARSQFSIKILRQS